jgi:hypothetical protein
MNSTPVKRDNAPKYILTMVVSFAVTVVITRFYLELTGYPQIGGGELHIAHLLWGGLALFIASLLPLILANRRAYDWAAVLSGVGVSLGVMALVLSLTVNNLLTFYQDQFQALTYTLVQGIVLLLAVTYRRWYLDDHAAEPKKTSTATSSL